MPFCSTQTPAASENHFLSNIFGIYCKSFSPEPKPSANQIKPTLSYNDNSFLIPVKFQKREILFLYRIADTFNVDPYGFADILLISVNAYFLIQYVQQLIFHFVIKFRDLHIRCLSIHQNTKWFHQITGKVERIKLIIMTNAQLRTVSKRNNFFCHCRKNNAITIIQRRIQRNLLCSGKIHSKHGIEINYSRMTFPISHIPWFYFPKILI